MAAITEVLRWTQMVAFAVVGAWAVASWLRHRRPAYVWLAVTFGSLAAVAVSGPVLDQLEGVLPVGVADALGRVLIAILAAFPYALLRLLDTFDPVGGVVRRVVGAYALVVGGTALVVAIPEPADGWSTSFTVFALALVGSWVVVLPGVAWRFWRVSAGRPSVARRRLRCLAAAVVALVVALVLMAAQGGTPSVPTELLSQVSALAAATLLVLGAVPPRWLRASWRQPEEVALHGAALGLMAATTPDEVAAVLVPHLRAVVAARGVAVVHRSRLLAQDGRADAAYALRTAAGSPGVAPPETVEAGAAGVRVVRQPLTDGAIVVWTDALTPFVGDDERRLLTRTALLADLALQRAELLASERRARVELAEANEELESFVYSASHDLKSPLIAMLGYIDVLTQEHGPRLEGDATFYLQRLVANGRYMESLIRDLLELSRIGRVQTVREEVDLEELVGSVVEELTARHPQLHLERDPLPVLRGNQTRLRQLFVNLLDNAVRHGPEERVHVEVRVAGVDGGGVEIVVGDDGPGIPEAYRERVFGVFERLDGDDRGGTGIGLAICRKVVETLGGRIWLGADEGGARFHIRLPADAVVTHVLSTGDRSDRTDQEVLT